MARTSEKAPAKTTRKAPARGVAIRKLTAAEKRSGTAKLKPPTSKRSAEKPTATKRTAVKKTAAKPTVSRATDAERAKLSARVAKLRASGTSWGEISETLGVSLSALARLRKAERNGGADRF